MSMFLRKKHQKLYHWSQRSSLSWILHVILYQPYCRTIAVEVVAVIDFACHIALPILPHTAAERKY